MTGHWNVCLCVQTQAQPVTGEFVRSITLQTSADWNSGLAISPDSAHMAVAHGNHTMSVYSLPGGEHIRTFGSAGAGQGRFVSPAKICFSVTGNILVAEQLNKRVQEVTLAGGHMRFIGAGVIDDFILGIAANAVLIVVGKWSCASNNRIMMFDAVTGVFVRAFGDYGDAPGQLMKFCSGIRFTPDSHHIVVAEGKGQRAGGRLSMFTLAGEFVRCVGNGELTNATDAEFADDGDVIVSDSSSHRICVYFPDGNTLLRQWGGEGDADGMLTSPIALAMCRGQLHVLDWKSKRLQVFE